MDPMNSCKLCGQPRNLLQSHIMPGFVIRWLKESGHTRIRSSQIPNKRVEDGPKINLLCYDCEQLLCSWEDSFSKSVFFPLHEKRLRVLPYGPWALKFAVSVSWRVFQYFEAAGKFDNLTEGQQQEALLACRRWEEFMKGSKPHPGTYEQHMIALDALEHVSGGDWSPFLNRYILRTVDLDVVAWDDCAMVYAKMGRILLFGFLTGQERRHWVETRLHVRGGQIGAKRYKVPLFVLKYINEMAEKSAKALASLSPRQNEKVERTFIENAVAVRESDLARAMRQDIRLFGRQAFTVTTPERFK